MNTEDIQKENAKLKEEIAEKKRRIMYIKKQAELREREEEKESIDLDAALAQI